MGAPVMVAGDPERAALAERVENATGLSGEMVQSPRLAPVIHAIYTAELVAALEVVRRAGVVARRYLQEHEG